MNNSNHVIAFAARLKDENELMKSSSGGMFTAISNYVLSNNGVIFASSYDYMHDSLKFTKADNRNDRDKMRGSIYFQSDARCLYSLVEDTIREYSSLLVKKPILVLGTPCQINALIKYLLEKKLSYDYLVLCDLVCHGVPSCKIWREYLDNIKMKFNIRGEGICVTFKDKMNGWDLPRAKFKYTSGEVYLDDYLRLFHSNLILRPSCYKCPFTTVNRESDITIGDFWSIKRYYPQFYSNKGVSMVLVHTLKGKKIIDLLKDSVDIMNCEVNECLQPNLLSPTHEPKQRSLFWNDYYKNGFEYALNKYTSLSIKYKFLRKFLQYMPLKIVEKIIYANKVPENELFVKMENLKTYSCFSDKYNCSGCSACYSICPQKAIEMVEDKEGFLYPEINFEKCISCHKCIKICGFKNKVLF